MKRGLGKGLDALISTSSSFETERAQSNESGGILQIDINKIEPNPNQPRRTFEAEALAELAASITEYGILQPLLAWQDENSGIYFIIAGERRWRAAKQAKLKYVPVIVQSLNEAQTLQVALIENIQREDLNPMEEAACYRRLIDEFSYIQEDLAKKVGKSRSHVSNLVRLLSLDRRVQAMVAENKLSLGHAKLLLPIDNKELQHDLASCIVERELSVRKAEQLVKAATDERPVPIVKKPLPAFLHITKDLQHLLGTKIDIKSGKNGGRIEIAYYSDDDLERIVDVIKKRS